jgi:MFS transporter, FSR family, fosmidomycin resistance protein
VVKSRTPNARPTRAGSLMLAAALAVVLVDELVDGTKTAALPLMRQDLHLSYGQVGLLASVPLLLGSALELPLGVLAGHGRRRRLAVLGGGAVFALALALAATARSFAILLVAFAAFFPASGAFVSLTQSGLMDADPARREQNMARWELAGSAGQLAGPILLVAVLAAGGGWRSAYLMLALLAVVAWLGVARVGPGMAAPPAAADPARSDPGQRGARHAARRVAGALRQPGVVRWLALIQACDLLLDVLTGFLGLYLVDVVHATKEQAALGVAIRLGAGLAGDAVLIPVLERARGLSVLRASVAAAALLYPAFLLAPGLWPKLLLLGILTIATTPWYAVLQAQLYSSLPGQSGVAVSLSSAATLLGGAVPLAVGFLAQRFGLSWALTSLAAAPLCLLGGLWRRPADAADGQAVLE